MAEAYTATVVISAPADEVFAFMRVPENQPAWGINFVRSTRRVSEGRYVMETPAGHLFYRVEADSRARSVDFIFESPGGETILPARAVPHPRGALFTFTILREPAMSDTDWEGGRRGLNEEVEQLRMLVEGRSG